MDGRSTRGENTVNMTSAPGGLTSDPTTPPGLGESYVTTRPLLRNMLENAATTRNKSP